jgi:hypothetical protein
VTGALGGGTVHLGFDLHAIDMSLDVRLDTIMRQVTTGKAVPFRQLLEHLSQGLRLKLQARFSATARAGIVVFAQNRAARYACPGIAVSANHSMAKAIAHAVMALAAKRVRVVQPAPPS